MLCATLDVRDGADDDFVEWHTREHLVERLHVPGFMRGRRFAREEASPRYLILYEVDHLSVLSSPRYVERLNNPTPWTKQAIASFRNGARSACSVAVARGVVEGAYVLMLRFRPANAALVRAAFDANALERFVAWPGVTAACLALPDRYASTLGTVESRASGNTASAEWLLLVEGISDEALAAFERTELTNERLRVQGVGAGSLLARFRLQAGVARRAIA
ncbi:DUF4286 family protein [Burkholderia pseudomultivorans]|uniref:DUF4286 family protein n=1 Tax=Burkholderia pseudomultivorans TaxID=1207504 RepID=UPI0001FD80EB|nr:DUF4286 family protein [Burkholderia pseudomultivorans]EGD03555.1 hypothetical protein B1M_15955 [Burkholderia sp. TJI49]